MLNPPITRAYPPSGAWHPDPGHHRRTAHPGHPAETWRALGRLRLLQLFLEGLHLVDEFRLTPAQLVRLVPGLVVLRPGRIRLARCGSWGLGNGLAEPARHHPRAAGRDSREQRHRRDRSELGHEHGPQNTFRQGGRARRDRPGDGVTGRDIHRGLGRRFRAALVTPRPRWPRRPGPAPGPRSASPGRGGSAGRGASRAPGSSGCGPCRPGSSAAGRPRRA